MKYSTSTRDLVSVVLVMATVTATASQVVDEEKDREAEEQAEQRVRDPTVAAAAVALHESTPAVHPRLARLDAVYRRFVHRLHVHLCTAYQLLLQPMDHYVSPTDTEE